MKKKNHNRKAGFGLVEVMVSIVLLVVLVVAGAATLYQTGGGIQRQQNKREAIMAANTIMERYWNRSYADLQSISGQPPIDTTVTVNGIGMHATIDVGAESTDVDLNPYLELGVVVDYLGLSDDVSITTRRYEYGLSRAAL